MEKFKVGDAPPKQSGGGDPNILQLKASNKVRLVDQSEAGIGGFRQHTIKNIEDPDDSAKVEFVPCPGPAICPLCRKPSRKGEDGKSVQNFPVSRRFVTNVWDYGSESVKLLIAGPQIFGEFEAAKEVGLDPLAQDWIIHKTGTGINTKYKLVRDNPTAFAHDVSAEDLIDFDKYGQAPSPEKIFELLEVQGWDYDALEAPEFTEQEALAFVMPYGKSVKGMTVEQALAQDPDFCQWLHGKKREQESYFDEVYLALDTAMVAAGMVKPLSEEQIQEQAAPPPAQEEPAAEPEPELVKLIDLGGEATEVPAAAADALIEAGYTRPNVAEEPTPEPEPEETGPAPIPGKAAVQVKIKGVAMPMSFKAALDVAKTGLDIEWLNPEHAEDYATFLISTGGEPPESVEVPQTETEAEMHQEAQDPQPDTGDDKPFKCTVEGCDWAGKTSGARTQHYNREHAPAAGEAAPADSNGSPSDHDAVFTKVTDHLRQLPEEKFRQVLGLFEEVANTRDLSEFTTEQLVTLEGKLADL